MLQAELPKLRAELADANAALEGALDAQEDAEQRMFSMRRERDAAKDCASGQGTGPCGMCIACTKESLERMRARVKSADDLFEKSMDAIHDRAGIKRNGLAGILAWIDEAHDIRSKVNGP